MVDSITSSFSEYGVLASELVGFVSEWDRVSRADGQKGKGKEKKGEEEKIPRVAGRNEGADEEREGFDIALPHKAKETLEYDGRCKNKSFLFKCPFSSLFALPSTLHHRSVYDPVRRSSLRHPS